MPLPEVFGLGVMIFDLRPDQVGPVVDALGVALADHEDDRGEVGQRVVRQPLLPAVVDEALLADGVGVGPEGQRGHVGLQSVDDGPRLAGRTPVRLLDRQSRPRLPLVLAG